jgi:hypothetical protein
VFTDSLPGNRRPIVLCVCLARTTKKTQFPLYCYHVLKVGVFTGRRIETAVHQLLPVFVAVRMFTKFPLLLYKHPVCHNILPLHWTISVHAS